MRDHEAPAWLLDQIEDEFADCWIWTGPKLQRFGGQGGDRAMVRRHGRVTTAARALWVDAVGELPRALLVRHTCDNGMCVRPSHLTLGTAADNTDDARQRRRLRPGGRVA